MTWISAWASRLTGGARWLLRAGVYLSPFLPPIAAPEDPPPDAQPGGERTTKLDVHDSRQPADDSVARHGQPEGRIAAVRRRPHQTAGTPPDAVRGSLGPRGGMKG